MIKDFSPIIEYVARYIQLTEEEVAYFVSLLRFIHVRKKQFIVQPDFTCKYRSYIVKGAMRSYLVGSEGQEHTIALAVEDWWISDFNSYIYQEPATLFVEAMEDTSLIQLDYDSEQLLLKAVPKFERFLRIITQGGFASLQKRILSNISKTAEQRYEEYVAQYPEIANRVPQYALASYLGFSPEFLSRIRNNKAKKLM